MITNIIELVWFVYSGSWSVSDLSLPCPLCMHLRSKSISS